MLPIDKTGELLDAAPGFQLVVSYNPAYQHVVKELKPSTRQRFVSIAFDVATEARERAIVAHEGGVDDPTAATLVSIATRVRRLRDRGLDEGPSTRLVVSMARLVAHGIPLAGACRSALLSLSDDPELNAAIGDVVDAHL